MNEDSKKKKAALVIVLLLLLLGIVIGLFSCISKDENTGNDIPVENVDKDTSEEDDEDVSAEQDDGIYEVQILKSAHGSVTANKTEAAEGDEIVLTVKPDEGYELKSLTVNKKKSETTFKMPAKDVKVLAKFSLIVGKGNFFGKSGDYVSSDVINFKTDKGLFPYLTLDTTKGTPLYAYINDLDAKQFYFETKVEVTDILDSEKYPKFGIMINDGTEMVKFYLDMNTKKLVPAVGTVHQGSGGDDDWANQDYFNLDETLDLSKKKVTLGLLRNGKTYYFYVNDELVATGSDLSDNASATGVFSFGTSLKLTNYKLVTSGTKFDKLLNEAKEDVAEFNKFSLTTNYFAESSNGVYKLKTNSADESKVDDVKYAGKVLKTPYYSIKGKLTLKNSKDWSQARILISSDAKNEYVIALEQTAKNKYQIFTMSKNNEEIWNNWTSIVGAEINGDRNSIDFEVIADGQKIYFLIDDMICYTSDSVSMTESTVKFAGYKNATTVVENLDGQIFAKSEDVQKYLATKDAESFWVYGLTTNHFKETKDGVYTLKTILKNESKVDDVTYGGNILRAPYYSIQGTLTLNNSTAWSQSRILISSDAKNECVIALEQTDKNKYQIFTMSKNNEDGWDNWTSIVDAEVNDDKNSIDFEVIADGNKIYFLIDDMIYYTNESVSMTESTVKFSNYGNATTVVENLDGYIFKSTTDVQNYLQTKSEKDFTGENFGVTVGDGITYATTSGINLEKDRGENPTIDIYGESPRYAYLNDTFTDKLYFETEIEVSDVLTIMENGEEKKDPYPKFGLILNGETESLKFFVDMREDMTASAVGVVHQPTNGGDDWANAVSTSVNNMEFTGGKTIKLAVVRDGNAYYFYVNGELVLVEDNAFIDAKSAVGIFSFNTVLTASDYTILKDEAAAKKIEDAIEDARFKLTKNHFQETNEGSGVYTLTTDSGDESKVDDLMRAGQVVRASYYSVTGKLTLTDAQDWAQARILVSSDAKNEHMIALERTNQGKYQIFAVSKADEEGWNWDKREWIWRGATERYGNSIDFEVIADGQKVYFLIDDVICYTSERVSMTESTVKFASYNSGTTTVENLDGQFFKNSEVVQDYLVTKNGENFGVTVGDGVSYKTTSCIDLTNDVGENATIEMFGESPRYAYLNDSYTDKFYFETEVDVREVLGGDQWPKLGFIIHNANENVKFYLDMTPEMTVSNVGVVHQKTGQGDDWANANVEALSSPLNLDQDTVKLALLRDGANYYFYVNDNIVAIGDDLTTKSSAVGFFSFAVAMDLSNYRFLLEGNEYNELLYDAKSATYSWTLTGQRFRQTEYYRTENPTNEVPHTFEAWIKVDKDVTERLGIIAGNFVNDQTQGAGFELRANGVPSLWWSDGTTAGKTICNFDNVHVNTGEWLHLTVTVEDNQANCYVNGELKQSIEADFVDNSLARQMCIGGDFRSGNAQYLKSTEVAQVAMFSDVRTGDEIITDMMNLDHTDSSLLGAYYLSGNDVSILEDYSTYENDLVTNNPTLDGIVLERGLTETEYFQQVASYGSTHQPTAKTRMKISFAIPMEAGTRITFVGDASVYKFAVIRTNNPKDVKASGAYQVDSGWISGNDFSMPEPEAGRSAEYPVIVVARQDGKAITQSELESLHFMFKVQGNKAIEAVEGGVLTETEYNAQFVHYGSVTQNAINTRMRLSFSIKMNAGTKIRFTGDASQYKWAVVETYNTTATTSMVDSGWNTKWSGSQTEYVTKYHGAFPVITLAAKDDRALTEADIALFHDMFEVEGNKYSQEEDLNLSKGITEAEYMQQVASYGSIDTSNMTATNRMKISFAISMEAGTQISFAGDARQYKFSVIQTNNTKNVKADGAYKIDSGWIIGNSSYVMTQPKTGYTDNYPIIVVTRIDGANMTQDEVASLHSMFTVRGNKATVTAADGELTAAEYNAQFAHFGSYSRDANKTRQRISFSIKMSAGTNVKFTGDTNTYKWAVVETANTIYTSGALDSGWNTSWSNPNATYVTQLNGAFPVLTIAKKDDSTLTTADLALIHDMFEVTGNKYTENTSAVEPKDYSINSVNHRGYCMLAPENTLSAYRLSALNGFKMVECDVNFTADGHAVLLHDDTIDRTSNGTGGISTLTLEEVRTYDFGSWKSYEYKGEKIPTFDEFIALCKELELHPYIELKNNLTKEQAKSLVDIVVKYGLLDNCTWISFNSNALSQILKYDETARVGLVTSALNSGTVATATALKNGKNEVFIDAYYTVATAEGVSLCKNAELPLEVWTVNNTTSLLKLDSYVSGVTSDFILAGAVLEDVDTDTDIES